LKALGGDDLVASGLQALSRLSDIVRGVFKRPASL
jgi:hypothetical protein